MIQFAIGMVVLVLLLYALVSSYKTSKKNKDVDSAKDRLDAIQNEHKILDINERVAEEEAKLKARKLEKQ